jgi:hypothetical protein
VRRVLLVLAMALSLWPAAVIAVAATNGSSKTETTQPSSGSGGSATPPGYARLKELQGQEEQILQRFHNSASTHGTPDPGLSEAAHELVSNYETWESENGGQNAEADKAEGLEVRIAQRVASFAAHPSQPAMNAFNKAVTEYNSNVR